MKAIRTRYHGPTNSRGARISATDNDGNTVRVPLDYGLDDNQRHAAAARALCAKMSWHGALQGGWAGGDWVWVWADERNRIEV